MGGRKGGKQEEKERGISKTVDDDEMRRVSEAHAVHDALQLSLSLSLSRLDGGWAGRLGLGGGGLGRWRRRNGKI